MKTINLNKIQAFLQMSPSQRIFLAILIKITYSTSDISCFNVSLEFIFIWYMFSVSFCQICFLSPDLDCKLHEGRSFAELTSLLG